MKEEKYEKKNNEYFVLYDREAENLRDQNTKNDIKLLDKYKEFTNYDDAISFSYKNLHQEIHLYQKLQRKSIDTKIKDVKKAYIVAGRQKDKYSFRGDEELLSLPCFEVISCKDESELEKAIEKHSKEHASKIVIGIELKLEMTKNVLKEYMEG